MSHTVAEVSTYTASVTVPDNGDSMMAEGVQGVAQPLANRTKYLKAQVDQLNTYVNADWGHGDTQSISGRDLWVIRGSGSNWDANTGAVRNADASASLYAFFPVHSDSLATTVKVQQRQLVAGSTRRSSVTLYHHKLDGTSVALGVTTIPDMATEFVIDISASLITSGYVMVTFTAAPFATNVDLYSLGLSTVRSPR